MKDRTKKRTRRTLIALLALALLLPLFAAFEAHIVNVKAHIENALEVTPKHIDFGVVFPQESLDATFSVGLSHSFMRQDRVEDVFYRLVQKQKPTPDKLDVLFAFDLTGSMGGAINGVITNAEAIMNALKVAGPDARFGVVTFVDYPKTYADYWGYSNTYGSGSDYPYRLELDLTNDTDAVKTELLLMSPGGGWDGPQDYTRVIHECYTDSNITWRPDAQQVVIMFGDNVPHDNNLNEGMPDPELTDPYVGSPWPSTGGDPGDDEAKMTADDLDLQSELAALAADGKKLCWVHYDNYYLADYFKYWAHWTEMTGGMAVDASSDVVAAIQELVEEDLFFYEDLRDFLTKTKVPDNDTEPDSENEASLDKAADPEDIEDIWNIHFDVPCIAGAVGQDYVGPIAPHEDDYGADIWVEVYGLSYEDDTTWPPDLER